MINIRKDLIEEELLNINSSKNFKYKKLSNKFIDWLFNHYYCHEMCENFYDSEPDTDEEEYNMYLDYLENTDEYSEKEHTKEEKKIIYNKIKQMYIDYEEERIEFCNWQEPYFEGNWDMSQKYVDKLARYVLKKEIRNIPNIKDRLYVSIEKKQIRIYWYGRDILYKDYWFVFLRKEK